MIIETGNGGASIGVGGIWRGSEIIVTVPGEPGEDGVTLESTHITRTDMVAVDKDNVTVDEYRDYLEAHPELRNQIVYYTATDVATDPTVMAMYVDGEGTAVTIEVPNPDAIIPQVFISRTDLAATDPDHPTLAELRTYITNNNLGKGIIYYTGTNTSTDETTVAVYADKLGNVILIERKPDEIDIPTPGLRGEPVADNEALAGLSAREYERRLVKSTGKEYVFKLEDDLTVEESGDSNNITDTANTGKWILQPNGNIVDFDYDIGMIRHSIPNSAKSIYEINGQTITDSKLAAFLNANPIIGFSVSEDTITFPDWRGRYLGASGGRGIPVPAGTIMESENKAHTHSVTYPVGDQNYNGGTGNTRWGDNADGTSSTSSNGGEYARPETVGMPLCIIGGRVLAVDIGGGVIIKQDLTDPTNDSVISTSGIAGYITRVSTSHLFLSTDVVGATDVLNPTLQEIQDAVTALSIYDDIVYYTGTTDEADTPIWVYSVDKFGNVILLSIKGESTGGTESGLRRSPVANTAALTALIAEDFELRFVVDTKKTYSFVANSRLTTAQNDNPNNIYDDNHTGKWVLEVDPVSPAFTFISRDNMDGYAGNLENPTESQFQVCITNLSIPMGTAYYTGTNEIGDPITHVIMVDEEVGDGTPTKIALVNNRLDTGLRRSPVMDTGDLEMMEGHNFELRRTDLNGNYYLFKMFYDLTMDEDNDPENVSDSTGSGKWVLQPRKWSKKTSYKPMDGIPIQDTGITMDIDLMETNEGKLVFVMKHADSNGGALWPEFSFDISRLKNNPEATLDGPGGIVVDILVDDWSDCTIGFTVDGGAGDAVFLEMRVEVLGY